MTNLIRLTEGQRESIKEDFLSIASLDNPSHHEDLVIQWIHDFLETHDLGQAEVDNEKNMLLRIEGEGEWLLLNAHTDGVDISVGKEPWFDGEYFRTNGKTILGADDLAGVIPILHTAKILKEQGIKHRPLEILFVSREEISGEGIKAFDKTKLKSKEGLLPDFVGPVGCVGIKAPSKHIFSIQVHGKPAHVKEIQEGVSAIKIMSEFLHTLPIGYIGEDMTLNVGFINGGRGLNIVPDFVEAKGELRGFDETACQTILDMLNQNIKTWQINHSNAKLEFTSKKVRTAYGHDTSEPIFEKLEKVTTDLGLEFKPQKTQGLSDASELTEAGVMTLCIGVGYEHPHTTNETVSLQSMVNLTEQILNFSKT